MFLTRFYSLHHKEEYSAYGLIAKKIKAWEFFNKIEILVIT